MEVTGIGVITDKNTSRVEQEAIENAFNKALLITALMHVPQCSVTNLVQTFPAYIAFRGSQDILQYKIISRSRQYDILKLKVEVILDEGPLVQWLNAKAITIPRGLRPGILLMISSSGPENETPEEWWNSKGTPAYNAIESLLADQLYLEGENIIRDPGEYKKPLFGKKAPLDIADNVGATFLVSGNCSYTPLQDTLYECSIAIDLIDAKDGSVVESWSFSRRGDMPKNEMNGIIINSFMNPLRKQISRRILAQNPQISTCRLCISGIREYSTYQSVIAALDSMDPVKDIKLKQIQGHEICHNITIMGSMEDIMENLKARQIVQMDIETKPGTATIRLHSPQN
jgi:hypothetical protein